MASQVQPILVKLGIEGYEELAKLKSAFRGLDATVNQSDAVLEKARKAILDYGKQAQNSEATLKGLETALKGVREQATLHSPLYKQLNQDIRSLNSEINNLANGYQNVATRATQAATAQQNAANAATRGNYFNRAAIRQQEEALRELGERVRQQVAATPLALPAAGQTSARGTGQAISGGARRLRGQVEYTFQNPLDVGGGAQVPSYLRDPRYAQLRNLQTTAATGVSPAVGFSGRDPSIQRAIPAYKEAQQELSKVLLSSNNTIQSLEKQRSAWNALRSAIDPASSTFANATKRVQELDKRLDSLSAKQQKVSKRGLGAQGITQIAGAAISGGIFGGPEGFLGGVAGGALGGVGGAFAGAAIGAQVAMLRQAAGATAEYAAAINQQRRALSGVVEDSAAYQQSLAFIDQTSRALAIPQEQVTRNFTRLSASVLGAGGDVAAAQEAFLGVSSAILGTGGTLADLDAALLATAQVFSKGKVSAEELRGQIGERLPGAFTLFAESIGKTPAELDKMLEKGQVTLNDFMKFVRLANTEYGKNVIAMSQSGEAAGRRLATAWGRTQEAIGKELQPLGAAFQTVFADFFEDNAGTIVAFVRGVVAGFNAIGDVIRGLGAYMAEMRRQFDDVVSAWTSRWTTFTSFFSSAFNGAGDIIFNRLGFLSTAFRAVADFIQNVFTQAFGAISDRWKATVRNIVNNSTPIGWVAQMLGLDPGKAVVAGLEGMASPPTPRPRQPNALPTPQSNVVFPAGLDAAAAEARKGKQGPKPPEDRTMELRTQLELFIQVAEYEDRIRDLRRDGREGLALQAELAKELAQIEAERITSLRSANYEGERAHTNALAQAKAVDARRKNEDAIRQLATERFKQEVQNRQAVRDVGDTINNIRKQQEYQLSDSKEYLRLIQTGMLPAEAQRIVQFERAVLLKKEELDMQIAITEAEIARARESNKGISTVDMERTLKQLQLQRDAITSAAAAGPGRAATDVERIQAGLAAAQGSLNELTNLGNIAVTVANNIGNAFGEAFNKLVTGAGSARQVLSEFFQSVAQSFFKMAQDIIAQQIVMITLQAILKALGGAVGGGGGATSFGANNPVGDFAFDSAPIPANTAFPTFAKGGTFTPQGPVERYAKGGIVNAPTLFRYAKGGTFAPGLMGEAGPEAILPLRRTPDGRLGVTQVRSPEGGDRMREMLGRSPAQQQAPTLNLKFETTTINGVEYVSREQLEVAMAETRKRASKEGAERGMSMTLDKMRNSPRTRAQVGMR